MNGNICDLSALEGGGAVFIEPLQGLISSATVNGAVAHLHRGGVSARAAIALKQGRSTFHPKWQ